MEESVEFEENEETNLEGSFEENEETNLEKSFEENEEINLEESFEFEENEEVNLEESFAENVTAIEEITLKEEVVTSAEMVHHTIKCMIDERSGIVECHRQADKLQLPFLCYFEVEDLNTEGPVPAKEIVKILSSKKSTDFQVKYSAEKDDCQTNLIVPYICQNIEISGTLPEEFQGLKLVERSSERLVDEDKRQRFEIAKKLFSEGKVLTIDEILNNE